VSRTRATVGFSTYREALEDWSA